MGRPSAKVASLFPSPQPRGDEVFMKLGQMCIVRDDLDALDGMTKQAIVTNRVLKPYMRTWSWILAGEASNESAPSLQFTFIAILNQTKPAEQPAGQELAFPIACLTQLPYPRGPGGAFSKKKTAFNKRDFGFY